MIAWAIATWQEREELLSGTLRWEARRQLCNFAAQDVSNLTWALAARSIHDAPLTAGLAAAACAKAAGLEPQHLCNVLWALASLPWLQRSEGGCLSTELQQRISGSEIEPPGLSATAWALANWVGIH